MGKLPFLVLFLQRGNLKVSAIQQKEEVAKAALDWPGHSDASHIDFHILPKISTVLFGI